MKLKETLFTKTKIKDFLVINFGLILMAVGYSIFVDPNNLIIGGVGGIATLFKSVLGDMKIFGFEIHSSYIIFILNIILLIFGYFFISRSFFIKTIYASVAYPVYVFIVEILLNLLGDNIIRITTVVEVLEISGLLSGKTITVITTGAYLLYVIFGAVLCGMGIGLVLKKGSSTGGVDIIQNILLRYLHIPFSVSLIIIDGAIVFLSALYFNDVFIILYGILFIIISGYAIDSMAFNGFNSRAVYIITVSPDAVKQKIYGLIDRGVTEIYAKTGYDGIETKMIICIMSNKEFYKIKNEILKIDAHAFIYVTRASEVHGEGFSYDMEK